jgi:cellobiose transport system permease protein
VTTRLDTTTTKGGGRSAPLGAVPERLSLSMRLRRLDVTVSPYLYIAPFFIVFLGFGLFPLAYTFYVSLNQWELGASTHQWVGFHNYVQLLTDAYFWNSLRNTGSIWVLSTVPQLLAALALAHVLNRRLRFRTLFRVGTLMPNVASVVAVSIVFAQLFGRDFGLVNWLLHFIGIGPVDWQVGRWSSHPAISSMVIWRWTGWNALLYLAALQAVPRELYEAAAIDGASSGQQFRKITIPMLRPAIIFTVIISTIYGMQIFAEPLLFDNNPGSVTGGASREFQTATMFLYEQGWRNLQFGYAAAVAWLLFIVIVLFVILNYSLTRRIRSTDR